MELGKLKKEALLPSINELSYKLEISRDTAEKGYKYLKSIGVINPVPGKGYYISSTDIKRKLKVFLLFNKLSAHNRRNNKFSRTSLPEHSERYIVK